jgi:hypothetical protein
MPAFFAEVAFTGECSGVFVRAFTSKVPFGVTAISSVSTRRHGIWKRFFAHMRQALSEGSSLACFDMFCAENSPFQLSSASPALGCQSEEPTAVMMLVKRG